MVATHFLLALVVLATATVVAVEAWGNVRGRIEVAPLWLRLVGLVLALACGILVVTGTLSTAAGFAAPATAPRSTASGTCSTPSTCTSARPPRSASRSCCRLAGPAQRAGVLGPRPSACSCSSSCRWVSAS